MMGAVAIILIVKLYILTNCNIVLRTFSIFLFLMCAINNTPIDIYISIVNNRRYTFYIIASTHDQINCYLLKLKFHVHVLHDVCVQI